MYGSYQLLGIDVCGGGDVYCLGVAGVVVGVIVGVLCCRSCRYQVHVVGAGVVACGGFRLPMLLIRLLLLIFLLVMMLLRC